MRDTSERGTGATHLLLLVVGCLLLVLMEVHLLMHVRLLHVELRKKLVCEMGVHDSIQHKAERGRLVAS